MQLYGQERLRKRNNYTSADDLKIMVHRFACIEFVFKTSRSYTYTHSHKRTLITYIHSDIEVHTHARDFYFFCLHVFLWVLIWILQLGRAYIMNAHNPVFSICKRFSTLINVIHRNIVNTGRRDVVVGGYRLILYSHRFNNSCTAATIFMII